MRNTLLSFTLRSFTDVDRALDEWRGRLQVVDDNLRELDDEPTLRKLEGRPGMVRVQLEGATAARVGPALRALRDVWAYRDRLADAIERAEELRKSVRPWSEAKQMQAIDDVLNGPSITLQSATTTPLALRGLMTQAQARNTVTPAQLLQAMERTYAEARDAVFAVAAAWDALLPSLTQRTRELDDIAARASRLDLSIEAELSTLRPALESIRRQIGADPLGAQGTASADLEPRLALLRARIDTQEKLRDAVRSDVARADALLLQLEATNEAARNAFERSRSEICDCPDLRVALDEGRIAGLRPWLTTLHDTIDRGHWDAAQVGLDRWQETAAGYLASAEAARTANCAPLEQREQLAGLLRARQAQAHDLARRGVYLAPEAEQAARQARALLAERPCRLADAQAAVAVFDRAVNALARR